MRKLTLLAALVLLPSTLLAQDIDPDLSSRTLEDVFRLGSEQDSWASLRQAAPVEELTRRARAEVLAMAASRLGNPAYAGTFRDAFLIRVLRAIRPEGLTEMLRSAYPGLDPGGRYEVLLYGVDERVEELRSVYADILRREEARPTRDQILAALFALQFPSSEFLGPLERLARQLERDSERNFNLSGYGEDSDPDLWVDEPEAMVRGAIRRVRAAPRHREMSAEERAILASFRGDILAPPRAAVHVAQQPLKEALAEIQRVYGVRPDPRSLRSLSDEILSRRVSIDEEDATAAEAFASFCNQTGFSTTAGYHVGAGAIGDPALTRNHAFASGGLVIEAEPREWDDDEVFVNVSVTSPKSWYWVGDEAFRLVEGRLRAGTSIPPAPDYSARLSILGVPISEREWNRAGKRIAFLEGDVEIPIPASIRRVRLPVEPSKSLHQVVDDIFFVDVITSGTEEDGFEVEVRFGIDIWDYSWKVTAMNLGDVDLVDEAGTSLEPYVCLSGWDLNFKRKGYRKSPPPAELVWTFAPLAEILRVRARWEDVRLASPN